MTHDSRMMTPAEKERIKDEILANCELIADCWIYKGAINRKGYGVKKINGKVYSTSRFILSFDSRESIEKPGYDACHRDDICPYKACCNPRHLYWATKSENCKAREQRAREEREVFTFWETHAWIDTVFYSDRPDPSIERCLANLNRGKIEHGTTVWEDSESEANPLIFLEDIYQQTLARHRGTVNLS